MKIIDYNQHSRFGHGPIWLCVFTDDGELLNVRSFKTEADYLNSRDDIEAVLQGLGHDVELLHVVVSRKLMSYEDIDDFLSPQQIYQQPRFMIQDQAEEEPDSGLATIDLGTPAKS